MSAMAISRKRGVSFADCMGIALALHLLGLLALEWNVRGTILTIPVKSLQIRLGSPVAAPEPALPAEMTATVAEPAATVRPPVPVPVAPPAPNIEKLLKIPAVKAEPRKDPAAAIPRQYLRPTDDSAVHMGSELGNSTASNAEAVSRYEQLLSLWLNRHRIYPEEARRQGLMGMAVVRLRIDRQGNIRFSRLEKSTGAAILDSAVRDMVAASNPVPPVPTIYPGEGDLEFRVPVMFK